MQTIEITVDEQLLRAADRAARRSKDLKRPTRDACYKALAVAVSARSERR